MFNFWLLSLTLRNLFVMRIVIFAVTLMIKVKKKAKSEIDTIKCHTQHGTPHGKVTKTQEESHTREQRGLPFPSK